MKVIEKRDTEGAYGFETTQAIIYHPKYGRILITDGWGGDDLEGYCYRWRHGVVAFLKENDSLTTLDKALNDYTSILDAVIHGYDDSRPLQMWPGAAVEKLANKLKL